MMRAALGYEFLRWLSLLAESELAFTDTSQSQDPSHSRAFPIWGISGGLRFTARLGAPRLAGFVEGDVGALAAAVPHNALTSLGFRAAETLGLAVGGRLGLAWYQVDPHLALTAQAGNRAALGFSRVAAAGNSGDVPLMWDVAAGLRYAF
jgi:hypothetical protein